MKIYQIYYDDYSSKNLDSLFFPYDNKNGNSNWYEYGVFRDFYFQKKFLEDEYTGCVSWKFKQKTRILTKHFIHFIEKKPGYDVYFINPFPGNTNLFRNVWECGEYYHPGLISIIQHIFQKINYKIDIENMINTHSDTLYCNYWVGNSFFWKKYIEFCEPIYQYIETSNDSFLKVSSKKTVDIANNANFIPFVMERLFTTLLYKEKKNIRYKPYLYKFTHAYPIPLYPVYLKLALLKKKELTGESISSARINLISFVNEYNDLIQKGNTLNIFMKILSRINIFIRALFKNNF